MALRVGLRSFAWASLAIGLSACASSSDGGDTTPGGGGGGAFGGAGGTGGFKPVGGSGGGPVGGAGGGPSGGGGQPGGSGGVGATGGAGAGGTATGGTGTGATAGTGGSGGKTTCVGHCNKTTPTAAGCYCDTACFSSGDCCDDYSTVCTGAGGGGTGGTAGTGGSGGVGGAGAGGGGGSGGAPSGSCAGSCGVQSAGGCWCDSGCVSLGDCCTDYKTVCGGTGGTGGVGGSGGTGGVGGTSGSGGVGGTSGSGGTGTGGTGGSGGTSTGGTGGSGGTGGVVGSCANAEDCSNPATMVCDPDTLTCGAGQCTATQACPTGQTCLGQVQKPVVGACYTSCTPYSTAGCSGSRECLSTQLDGTEGGCFNRGSKTEGAACTVADTNTGCAAGHYCVRDLGSYVCRKLCNYFASSPGCLLAQRCSIGGICSAESGDSAAIGAACSVSSVAGETCANDGKAWRGTCQTVSGTLTCLKVCRTSVTADCTSPKTCVPFQGDNSAGVCF